MSLRKEAAGTAKETQRNFLTGAAILAAAISIVKALGALFKIPLFNLLGGEGNGYFNIAYTIYNVLFVVSTTGLPIALSKMVAEANAAGRRQETARIFRVALATFVAVGAAGTVLLLAGAGLFAEVMGSPASRWAIVAIAPEMLLVMLASAFRGYHQGFGNMVPTAVSQIIEAAGKLLIGFSAAWWLGQAGYGPEIMAAGAIGGVTVGTLACAAWLSFVRRPVPPSPDPEEAAPRRALLKRLVKIAVPITIGSGMLALANFIDMTLVVRRLQESGLREETLRRLFDLGLISELARDKGATWLYGTYQAAVNLFNLPPSIIASLAVSIIPAVTAALARRDTEGARRDVESSLRVTALLILPAGAGLTALSWPVLNLLYPAQPVSNETAGSLLAVLGGAVVFCSLSLLTNAALQAYGKAHIPVFSMLAGGAVKIAVNYILVGIPTVGIQGAPIGTLLCYAVISGVNMAILRRSAALPPLGRTFFRPLLAAVGMGGAVRLIYMAAERVAGARTGAVASIGIGVVLYFVLIVALRAVRREDLALLPKGDTLARFLRL